MAALFAVHPLHVESVAWVWERKDVLSTFFFLLALWAYVRYAQGQSGAGERELNMRSGSLVLDPRRWTLDYGLAVLFFGLALMAKAMVVTLPFVLLLLDFWPLERLRIADCGLRTQKNSAPQLPGAMTGGVDSSRRSSTVTESERSRLNHLLLEKGPFFLLAFLSCWMTCQSMWLSGGFTAGDEVPLGLRLTNVPVSYASYLIKLFWPVNLAAFLPHAQTMGILAVVASVLLLAALTWLAVNSRNRHSCWLFGWLFFAGTLVPVAGFLPNGFHALADRYTYIPAIGIFVAVVWGIGDAIRGRAIRVVVSSLAVMVIGLLGWVAWRQAQVWRNTYTLWTHCLRVTPQNAIAEHNLGLFYWDSGETNLALKHYAIAVQLQPHAFEANVNYGVALFELGRNVEATNCLNRAVAALPQAAIARYDLGLALMALGDFAGAAVQCQKAVDLESLNPRNWFGLGRARAGLNQHQESLECFQRALQLGLQNPEANFRMGRELNALGRYDEALNNLSQAVAFMPRWTEAWLEMAVACVNQHDEPQAVSCYRRALDVDPSCLSALNIWRGCWPRAKTRHCATAARRFVCPNGPAN